MGMSMQIARDGLDRFKQHWKADWIPDDIPALDSLPNIHSELTDHYLADLAAKHGLILATLDTGIKHPAVELIR